MSGQSYPSVEHIVIDGGSTDDTVALLESTRNVKWISEPDSGQAAAINKGFSMAQGEILTWLNADDYLLPGAIESCVRKMVAGRLGWVYGNVLVKEPHNEWVSVGPGDPYHEFFRLGKACSISQQGSFFTATSIQRVGCLNERLHLAMDFDLWLRLLQARIPFAHLDEVVAVFEIHSGSKTGRSAPSAFFEDEARAFASIGEITLALIALGRAATHAVAIDGRVSHMRLRREVVRRVRTWTDSKDDKRPGAIKMGIWAGARTEAALMELGTSKAGLFHLLSAQPWAIPQTRRRLLEVVVRRLQEVRNVF